MPSEIVITLPSDVDELHYVRLAARGKQHTVVVCWKDEAWGEGRGSTPEIALRRARVNHEKRQTTQEKQRQDAARCQDGCCTQSQS